MSVTTDSTLVSGACDADSAERLKVFCESRRGSVQSLTEQRDGRSSPRCSDSVGHMNTPAAPPEALSAMCLSIFAFFCPSPPINLLALYFAYASRSMLHANDLAGAKRLARRSLFFSLISIIVGLSVILYLTMA